MKKLRLAVAVALVASFSVLAASSPAQAQYGVVTVNVSERTVVGGNSIQITATANIECDSWEMEFMGQEASGGQGSSFSHTFTTPEVDEEEDHVATATCFYDDGVDALGSGGGGRTLGTSVATVETSAEGSGTQTLLPRDDDDGDDDGDDGDGDDDGDDDGDGDGDGDDDGDGNGGDNGGLLPNTGGERLAWLIIGAMLVLVGGGVYMASRQRDA